MSDTKKYKTLDIDDQDEFDAAIEAGEVDVCPSCLGHDLHFRRSDDIMYPSYISCGNCGTSRFPEEWNERGHMDIERMEWSRNERMVDVWVQGSLTGRIYQQESEWRAICWPTRAQEIGIYDSKDEAEKAMSDWLSENEQVFWGTTEKLQ